MANHYCHGDLYYLAGCRLMHLLELAPWIQPKSNTFDDMLGRFYAPMVYRILSQPSRLLQMARGIRPKIWAWSPR